MVNVEFKKALMNEKKKIAYNTVKKICKERGLPMPKVNFDGCPEEDNINQLAHYHPKYNIVCISETQLKKQDYEEIADTMAHEVSHINFQDHSTKFKDDEILSRIAGWKPPKSVETNIIKKIPKKEINDDLCDFHDCSNKKLKKCKFCGDSFCKEHLTPKPAGVRKFNNRNALDKLLENEMDNDFAHPCLPYNDYLEAKYKQESENYKQALDSFAGKQKTVVVNLDDNYSYRDTVNEVKNNKGSTIRRNTLSEGLCNVHSCHKTATKKCPYCKDMFCEEHFASKPAGIRDFNSTKALNILKQEEVRREDAHPCYAYNDYLEKKYEEQGKRYGETLDKFKNSPYKHFDDETKEHKIKYDNNESEDSFGKSLLKLAAGIIIIMSIIATGFAIAQLVDYYQPNNETVITINNQTDNQNNKTNIISENSNNINTGLSCSISTTTVDNVYYPTFEEMQTKMISLCTIYCRAKPQESNCVNSKVICKC